MLCKIANEYRKEQGIEHTTSKATNMATNMATNKATTSQRTCNPNSEVLWIEDRLADLGCELDAL
jgi:hypothetical protein